MKKNFLIFQLFYAVVQSAASQTADTSFKAQSQKIVRIDSVHYSLQQLNSEGGVQRLDLQMDSIRIIIDFQQNSMPETISYRFSDEVQGQFAVDQLGGLNYTCESFNCENGWQVFYDPESKTIVEKIQHENGQFTGQRIVYNEHGQIEYESFRNGDFLIVNIYNDDLDIIEHRKINLIENLTTIDYYDPEGFRYQRDIGNSTDIQSRIIFNRDGTKTVKKFNID